MRSFALAACVVIALGVSGGVAANTVHEDTVRVRPGQSLSTILYRHRIRNADMVRLLAAGPEARRLESLRAGQQITLLRGPDRRLLRLSLHLNAERSLHFQRDRDNESFTVHEEVRQLERRTATAQATISSSLYNAARKAGLSNRIVMALAGIFEWDVDLALDLQRGDRFSLVYEELYLDERKVRDGEVLAAELVNRGRVHRALRYRDPEGKVGYYTPEGVSVQGAFLRSPVEFTRISSRFSSGRRHPLLQRVRAHRGVDYAAAPGTPVRATSGGRVLLAGRNGGYGNTVVLAHGGQITTLYAHLSRFARGLSRGARVNQGQTIGYVGQSGLATGPHLHYEFRVRGTHRDALGVDLPAGEPVPDHFREHFQAATTPLASRLASVGHVQLVSR
jgi:murein DD-endopeptidase MepM/ murein hydrolase activator NlpD